MPAAMRRTVLISMCILTVCEASTSRRVMTSSASMVPAKYITAATSKTNNANISMLFAIKVATTSKGNGLPTSAKPLVPTSAHSIQTSSTAKPLVPTPSSSNPTMTPNGATAEIPTKQPTNGSTVHMLPTPSGKPSVITTAIGNDTTTTAHQFGEKDLAKNPGLVAVLCIFFIVLGLALVVAVIKACQSRRSNFERLDDVPMGKVNEESPFANYSKQ